MINTTTYSPTAAERVMVFLSCVLLFVWSLPGTIALRLALTLVLLGLTLWQSRKSDLTARELVSAHQRLTGVYLALSAWLVLQALLLSVHPDLAIKEFWGQWLRAGISGLIGFLVASLITRRHPGRSGPLLALSLTLTLAFQIGLHDVDTLWRWWHEGQLPFQQTRIVANRSGMSFLTNLLMSLLGAEAVSRILYRRRYLPISWIWMAVLFAMCLFTTYVVGTRYGTIGFLTLIISCSVVGLVAKKKDINLPILIGVGAIIAIGIGAFGWAAVKSDARWLTLKETIPVALDTDHQRAWRDASLPMPLLPSGASAEESAYLRLSWAKEASLAIVHHPLGVGYGRNAFGYAMQIYYPDYASSLHCHSGILNFTVGAGIPGLLLWLGFIGLLAIRGWQAFFRRENPAGLLLLFVVSGFFLRSLVDGNFQDHMFEQFMFLALLFYILAGQDQRIAD